jgi:eukaryotic-like serine/threonine-protein kinase
MLTGTPPFAAADPIELERLHLEAPPPPPGRLAPVPPAVDDVTTRALAKRPADRFPSAAAFAAALRAAIEGDVAGERDAPGTGVHVAVLAAEPDEESAVIQATLEAEAEAALSAAGFSIDVRAPGALLATRLLPEEPGAARSERARVVAIARALADRLAADAGASAAVRVSVHAADVRLAADGARRVGGPLFRAADWVRPRDAVFDATPAALA